MSLTIEAPLTAPSTDMTTDVMLDDRRCAPRVQRSLAADVRPVGLNESQRCDVEDISEGGLFVFVPFSYGLNVGQRCEVQLQTTHGLSCSPSGDVCFATVVRTEVIAVESGKQLGAGLRFDQPLFL